MKYPEIISQNIQGLTPKQAYDRVISEIPIDNYDSYDVVIYVVIVLNTDFPVLIAQHMYINIILDKVNYVLLCLHIGYCIIVLANGKN